MNIEVLPKRFINQETKCISAFHLVLVYEDYLAGRRAMDSYGLLLSQFDDEFECQTGMWRFDALEGTTTFKAAVRDAVQADAIIVATYQSELPVRIRQWIDAWIPQKRGQKAALIAFLRSDCASSAWHYLDLAAANAGLDFFATALDPPEIRIPPSSSAVREAWGLNE